MLQGDAQVAARCLPADSVGGDFYTFTRLGRGRVGVMLGDVSSHGFSAALVMALVHVGGRHPRRRLAHPRRDAAPRCWRASRPSSPTTEMYFTVFYGVLDPLTRTALVRQRGPSARLPGSAARRSRAARGHRAAARPRPPGSHPARARCPGASAHDLLVLWTDGLVDARNDEGRAVRRARGSSPRVVRACASEPPEEIVQAVLAEAEAFGSRPTDDRTLLVMRI